MRERQASQKAVDEYETTVREIEENLKSARSAASATRDEFEQNALKEKEKILSDVSEECRAQLNEAKSEISTQVQALKRELENESKNIAQMIEKKLLDS